MPCQIVRSLLAKDQVFDTTLIDECFERPSLVVIFKGTSILSKRPALFSSHFTQPLTRCKKTQKGSFKNKVGDCDMFLKTGVIKAILGITMYQLNFCLKDMEVS